MKARARCFVLRLLIWIRIPKNEDGTVDYTKDFFGKETSLTVSGQLNGETYAQAFRSIYTLRPDTSARRIQTQPVMRQSFWMIEPEIAFADLEDDMDLAESMLKYVSSIMFLKTRRKR